MSSTRVNATHGPTECAGRPGSLVRALDGINRAVQDGCDKIHGIRVKATATDGRSIDVEVETLGLPFVISIRPGTLDEADEAPDVVPALALFDGEDDGCGSEPRAYPIGHGFTEGPEAMARRVLAGHRVSGVELDD